MDGKREWFAEVAVALDHVIGHVHLAFTSRGPSLQNMFKVGEVHLSL
jgi:hypothetical protein